MIMNQIKIYILFFVTVTFFVACINKERQDQKQATLEMMARTDSKSEVVKEASDISLESLIKPTNEYANSRGAVTVLEQRYDEIQVPALGTVQYDNRQIGTVSSRVEGRIEKMYVRYRYQYINKGDKILDIYSPELLTSQQNYLFVLQNDKGNIPLLSAARQRLLLLGMTAQQLNQITSSGKPLFSVSVYSNYAGYVNEMQISQKGMNASASGQVTQPMQEIQTTPELSLKEGMYLQKGQPVVTVINANRALIILNINPDQQALVQPGNAVKITPETAPDKLFAGKIDYIDPFFRPESKTLTARIYFNNSSLKLPIGSQVTAFIFTKGLKGSWLPSSAVLTLGLNKIVFKKEGDGFRAVPVTTGINNNDKIQITKGLFTTDTVAVNAQYLVDKESTIKTKLP